MQLERCKSCGGDLNRVGNYFVCKFCGSKWMIDADQDVHVIDRANAWASLRDCDFEHATELFENIIFKDPENHEAYWGRALSNAGIMYVTDFHENKKVPTCNSISETSFINGRDVKRAIELAPSDIAESYRTQADRIEAIRVEWVKKASREPAYDVFISYKDSDRENNIERTDDSYDAHELYNALTAEGYKVFFSRVSLRDKVSEHYEPYIYNAIKTAKVMIVFGEKPEYFNAVWIKNEWMRFRKRIELGEKHPAGLVVAYKGLDPADLPVGLRSRQCLDAGGMTFLEDLKRHIAKIVRSKPAPKVIDDPILSSDTPVKKKSKKGIAIAAIAAALVVCIAVGFVVAKFATNSPDPDTRPENPLVTEGITYQTDNTVTESPVQTQAPTNNPTDNPSDNSTNNPNNNETAVPSETQTPSDNETEGSGNDGQLPTEASTEDSTEGNSGSDIGDSGMTGGEDYLPNVAQNNYGQDLNIFAAPDTYTNMFFMSSDSSGTNALDEAVFHRQQTVEDHLGINIVLVQNANATFADYYLDVQNATQSMDGSIDALITHPHGSIASLIGGSLLSDLSEFQSIDLDADYWNKAFMDTISLKGHYYLGFSDFNFLLTHVIAFNKDMLSIYEGSLDKSVYELVGNGEWTLEEMMSLASMVYIDTSANGKTADDTFGISGTCWESFCGFLTSSDIPMVQQDQNGNYKVAITNSANSAKSNMLVESLRELSESYSAYFDTNHDKCSVPLTSGRTLMQLMSTTELPTLSEMEFGILPYPMLDSSQASVGYKSLQWGGYLAVPSYVKNSAMVGDALEVLSFYSDAVEDAFYEKLIGGQLLSSPEDAQMLEIIRNSITVDFGQTYSSTDISSSERGVCYIVPEVLSGSASLSMYVMAKESTINSGFSRFLDAIE